MIKTKVVGGIGEKKSNNNTQWYQHDRIYEGNVAITITTECNPYYAINDVVKLGNYSPSNHNASRIVDKEYSAPTVMENHSTITATQTNDLRIRKLTPRECFRLMGVKDEDYEKIAKNQSDSSLYHLAGDSLITTIMMALFSQMLDINWEDKLWNIKNTMKKENT